MSSKYRFSRFLALLLFGLSLSAAQAGMLKKKKKTVACPRAVAHGTSVQQVCLTGGTIVCPQVALEGGTIHQDCIGKVRRCARTANPNDNIHADCRGVTNVLAEAAAESGECTDVANDGRRCVSAETCETEVNDDNERVRVCRQCTTTTRPIAEESTNDDGDDNTEGDNTQSGIGGGSGSQR